VRWGSPNRGGSCRQSVVDTGTRGGFGRKTPPSGDNGGKGDWAHTSAQTAGDYAVKRKYGPTRRGKLGKRLKSLLMKSFAIAGGGGSWEGIGGENMNDRISLGRLLRLCPE